MSGYWLVVALLVVALLAVSATAFDADDPDDQSTPPSLPLPPTDPPAHLSRTPAITKPDPTPPDTG